jgi:hypothetical protein
MLDGIVARGSPVTANRVLAWFRRMCAWAIERGLVEALPCAGIRAPAAETSELEAVWRAADALETPYNCFRQGFDSDRRTAERSRRNDVARDQF